MTRIETIEDAMAEIQRLQGVVSAAQGYMINAAIGLRSGDTKERVAKLLDDGLRRCRVEAEQ